MGLEPIPKKDLFLRQACLPVPPSEYLEKDINIIYVIYNYMLLELNI